MIYISTKLLAIDYGQLQNQATPKFPLGTSIGQIITSVVGIFYPIAGLAVLAYLIYGAYLYLTSAGDPKAIQTSTKTITYAIIGFFILIAAFAVTNALGLTLGLTAITDMFR